MDSDKLSSSINNWEEEEEEEGIMNEGRIA